MISPAPPAAADGLPPGVKGHVAMTIPESLRDAAKTALVEALPVSKKVEW
jgi:hypothetical protein